MARRQARHLAKRIGDLGLGQVTDRRQPQWCKWWLRSVLTMLAAGLLAGCRGLAEVEELSTTLSIETTGPSATAQAPGRSSGDRFC